MKIGRKALKKMKKVSPLYAIITSPKQLQQENIRTTFFPVQQANGKKVNKADKKAK